jgi:hypothetical protein
MRLANDNNTPSRFRVFYYEGKDEKGRVKTFRVGPANSIPQLVQWSQAQMKNQGVELPENLETLREIIEHQICIRMVHPYRYCYSGGIGDDIHNKWIKPFLSSIEVKVEKMGKLGKLVATVVKKVKSCGGCGGTRVFKSGVNNMGRAGKLNKLKPNK